MAQTLRRHKLTPPGSDTESPLNKGTDQISDTGNKTDSGANGEELATIRSGLLSYLTNSEKDPSPKLTRERVMAKGWRKDATMLERVDQTMADIWETEGDGTMCSLNCLLYAGAHFVADKVKNGEVIIEEEEKDETDILSTDSPLEGDYFENGEWESDPWEGIMQPDVPMETETSEINAKISKGDSIKDLRKTIGWIDAEIARIKQGGGHKKMTRKRAILLKRLHRLFGKETFNLRRLKSLREKQVALLRIRTLQQSRIKQQDTQKRVNQLFRSNGPKCLTEKPSRRLQQKQN